MKDTAVGLMIALIYMIIGPVLSNSAQAQDGRLSKEHIDQLSEWVGTWKGSGWQMTESRQRVEFEVEEVVESKIGGLALMVEGKSIEFQGKEGHHAIGMIYYNLDNKRYEFHSFIKEGMTALATAKIDENGDFIWGFDVPGGQILYTITIDGDSWVEKGSFSMDGNQWWPFMEMTLSRQ